MITILSILPLLLCNSWNNYNIKYTHVFIKKYKNTSWTASAGTFAWLRTPLIAKTPNSGADKDANFERNDPIGVRTALRITAF